MARPVQALIAAAAALLAAAPAAEAHSLVRVVDGVVFYTSQDATSLNTLTVRSVGNEIEFRDPTVDNGMDIGTCRPGDIGADGNPVQSFCPAAGITRVRVDLADREDTAMITPAIPTEVLGGSGADTLTTGDFPDVVNGGEGNDRLGSGAGDDLVTGGLGIDDIDAGPGNDDVRAADGLADAVQCGDGADRVEADGFDTVAIDCETVMRTMTAPPAAPVAAADKTPPKVDASAVTVQRLGRRAVVRVAATSSERGTVGMSGFVNIAGLSLPLGTTTKRISVAGGGAELAIKLTRRELREARRALRRNRRVTARLSVVATDTAGNSAARRVPRIRLRK